ncbi:hypothetical protein K445DRAFT_308290 [Daldinia sp. EC12]|nr:hypothetical protein K445DRAFT_308290 [Daldinia sp. EC12]
MSETLPETFVDFLKRYNTFSDLPDDLDMPPQSKAHWRQLGPSNAGFSKGDIEFMKIEEYLRMKWPCSEPMPAPFDPEKLEAARQAKAKSHNEDKSVTEMNAMDSPENEAGSHDSHVKEQRQIGEHVSDVMYPEEANTSVESLFADVTLLQPLDSGEQLEEYNSKVTIETVSSGSISQGPFVAVSDYVLVTRGVTGVFSFSIILSQYLGTRRIDNKDKFDYIVTLSLIGDGISQVSSLMLKYEPTCLIWKRRWSSKGP